MAIRFSCKCGKHFQTKIEFAGKTTKCTGCGREISIPVPPEMLEEIDPTPSPEPQQARSNEMPKIVVREEGAKAASEDGDRASTKRKSKAPFFAFIAVFSLLAIGGVTAFALLSDIGSSNPPAENATAQAMPASTRPAKNSDSGGTMARSAPVSSEALNPAAAEGNSTSEPGVDTGEQAGTGNQDSAGSEEAAGNSEEPLPPKSREEADYAKMTEFFYAYAHPKYQPVANPRDDFEMISSDDPEFPVLMVTKMDSVMRLAQLKNSPVTEVSDLAHKAYPIFMMYTYQFAMHIKSDGSLEGAIFELVTKELARAVLRQGAADFQAYQRRELTPLIEVAKRISAPESAGQAPIELFPIAGISAFDPDNMDRIGAVNHSGRTLNRCTLQITSRKFYRHDGEYTTTCYIDEWPAGDVYYIPVGFARSLTNTINMELSLWSHEVSYVGSVTDLAKERRSIAEREMRAVRPLIATHKYESAKWRAERIHEVVQDDVTLASKASALMAEIDERIARRERLIRETRHLVAHLVPYSKFDGLWKYNDSGGDYVFRINKARGDGSFVEGVFYEQSDSSIRKRLTGQLAPNLDTGTLELVMQADPQTGARNGGRSYPVTRNMLLRGADQTYTFTWETDHFEQIDDQGLHHELTPQQPIDITAAIPPPIKEGALFEGAVYENGMPYAANLEITSMTGSEFVAIVSYPEIENSKSRIRGTVDGSRLVYTEGTVYSGPVKEGAEYSIQLDGPFWEGRWHNGDNSGQVRMVQIVSRD